MLISLTPDVNEAEVTMCGELGNEAEVGERSGVRVRHASLSMANSDQPAERMGVEVEVGLVVGAGVGGEAAGREAVRLLDASES